MSHKRRLLLILLLIFSAMGNVLSLFNFCAIVFNNVQGECRRRFE